MLPWKHRGRKRTAWKFDGATQYLSKSSPTGLDLNGSELCTNGTFESGVTGWSATNGITFTQSLVVSHSGTYSGKLLSDGTANGQVQINPLLVDASTNKFTVEFWAYAPNTSTGKTVHISFVDQASTSIKVGGSVTLTANTWTKFVLNYQLPGTQTSYGIKVVYENPSVGDILYIDDVSLKQAYDSLVNVIAYSTNSATDQNMISRETTFGVGFIGWNCLLRTTPNIDFEFNDGTNRVSNSVNNNYVDGRYHFYSFTAQRDGNSVVYKDGVALSTFSITTCGNLTNNKDLRIGGFTPGSAILSGGVGESQIFLFPTGLPSNIAQTISQINSTWKRNGLPKSINGILPAFWNNPLYGPRDLSSNGNNLTAIAAPPRITF